MARTIRNINLENRTNRFLLGEKKKYWQPIGEGLSLGYRRSEAQSSWYVRVRHGSKVIQKVIAEADDHKDDNGETVLNYKQAMREVIKIQNTEQQLKVDYTVEQAMADYVEWYILNGNRGAGGKAPGRLQTTIDAHIISPLGSFKVASLTTRDIRKWHNSLGSAPARLRTRRGGKQNVKENNDPRARKSSANRVLSIIKAALNLAYQDAYTGSDDAWRRVKPFRNVERARVRSLTKDEARRLVNACDDDTRQLVQAALMTGCRYGELCGLHANEFDPDSKTLFIAESKSGKPRHIPLTDDGVSFFTRATAGKSGAALVFTRKGHAWGRSHQSRPLAEACARAKIEPAVSFHIMRHTYASHLVMSGVPMEVVAHVLGHSDTRITTKNYAHLAPSYVAEAVRANMPTLGNTELDNVVAIKTA